MRRNPFRLKQVSVRLRAERPLLAERPVRTPEDAAKLVKDLIADFDREAVCIVNLRNDLCPINFSVCSIGTLTASMAEPREMIKAMAAEKAIIISTHILEEVDAVCTRAIVIAHGEIKADGTPDELRAKDPSGKLDVVFRNLTMEGEVK